MPPQLRHWWRCDGPCRMRSPLFGWVRRATNRPPGPGDSWWPEHSCTCGGRFVKVKEPVEYTMKRMRGLLSHGGGRITVNNVTFDLANSGETSQHVIDLCSSYSPARVLRLNRRRSTRHLWIEQPLIDLTSISPTEFVSIRNQKDKRHISTRPILGNQPIIDLTSQDFQHPNFEAQPTIDITVSKTIEPASERIITNGFTGCPMCTKQMPKEIVSEHLKECGDLQLLNEEDRIAIDEKSCVSQRKDETKSCACPLCSKVLKGNVEDHLKECDGIQGIFDDDIIDGIVNTDETCLKKVQSSTIDIRLNFLPMTSLFQRIIIGKFTQCPICMKGVLKKALQQHLKECGDLQKLIGEDINDMISQKLCDSQENESTKKCRPANSKALEVCNKDRSGEFDSIRVYGNENFNISKNYVICPICLKEVKGDLLLHIGNCVASDMVDDNVEQKQKIKENGDQEKCIVCEQALPNISLKNHLQNCEGLHD